MFLAAAHALARISRVADPSARYSRVDQPASAAGENVLLRRTGKREGLLSNDTGSLAQRHIRLSGPRIRFLSLRHAPFVPGNFFISQALMPHPMVCFGHSIQEAVHMKYDAIIIVRPRRKPLAYHLADLGCPSRSSRKVSRRRDQHRRTPPKRWFTGAVARYARNAARWASTLERQRRSPKMCSKDEVVSAFAVASRNNRQAPNLRLHRGTPVLLSASTPGW